MIKESKIGAGILNIITESLYDQPIVVFREYVQNSVDSFRKAEHTDKSTFKSIIWNNEKDLFFLDNGVGINEEKFESEMINIAHSSKNKHTNIGYKGIGRLSGLPYCQNLIFVNIISYKKNIFQKFYIDGDKYKQLLKKDGLNQMEFSALMKQIGTLVTPTTEEIQYIKETILPYKEIFVKSDTGFLVNLNNVRTVLQKTFVNQNKFLNELGWLLPVPFKTELISHEFSAHLLFDELQSTDAKFIPAEGYDVVYNGNKITRPITKSMFRPCISKKSFKYAEGFITFSNSKLTVDKTSEFTGIKIYLDNVLLCDEGELIPTLHQYGLLPHTVNEALVSVRGTGTMIYITDKISISANARRTFIEVTDDASFEFLKELAALVNQIYDTRYALSKYQVAKGKNNQSAAKLENLKQNANQKLAELASSDIPFTVEEYEPTEFEDLSEIEKKQAIKKKISKYLNDNLRNYLEQLRSCNYENAEKDFLTWLEGK